MVGITADASEQHVTCREIEAVELKRAVPSHQRVVFIPQTQCCGEFIGHAITISDKQSILPFSRRCLNELFALAHSNAISTAGAQFACETELKLGEGVELVRRRTSIICGHSPAEVKFSTRARAQLRLPMVQVMMNDVDSRADLVLTA